MTKAETIFEKHIGVNAEHGYVNITKEEVIDALKYKVSLKAIECIKYKLTWKHL